MLNTIGVGGLASRFLLPDFFFGRIRFHVRNQVEFVDIDDQDNAEDVEFLDGLLGVFFKTGLFDFIGKAGRFDKMSFKSWWYFFLL